MITEVPVLKLIKKRTLMKTDCNFSRRMVSPYLPAMIPVSVRVNFLWLGLMAWIVLSRLGVDAAQYNLVHAFAGSPNDGANPSYGSSLIASGSMLYGVTQNGGVSNSGVLFGIRTNGTGWQVLHNFNGYTILNTTASKNDGARPHGSPLLVGNTLYGTTLWGGSNGIGTVYSINTNGTGFQVLHHFGNLNDGYGPYGSLVLSGTNLYGLTLNGGAGSEGTIFAINTNGTGYHILHNFTANSIDGLAPWGSLVATNSVLYGMTIFGGPLNNGTVFKINDSGAGYQILHNFIGTTNDGSQPYGSLIISDSTLYGMTSSGGANNVGTVFQLQNNGSGFQLLHSFATTEGWAPFGDLTLSSNLLYGMTHSGGDGGLGSGVAFQIGTNGGGYQILHSFQFPITTTDGSMPFGSLLLLGSKLYGMTQLGCSMSPNAGGIFALDLAVSAPTITTTSPLPVGGVSVAYSQPLAATGGTTPYTWALVSGTLPAGLKLSSAGLISGTPTAGTTANFSVKVTGQNGLSSTQAFSLTIIVPDLTPPVLAITTPTAGQRVTNQVIALAGTASDNVAVAGIRWQLNGGPWIIGLTVNGNAFTNWYYPSLVLTPGTNTALAYAIDSSGNHSKTNAVSFVYYLASPLTVITNGLGSITPNYSNALLQIGATYSLTAKPATGFAFANWTDGLGNVLTNGLTLKFAMKTNLTVVANFRDIVKPILTVTAPTAGQRWSNVLFSASGKATDNLAVSNVVYSLNGSDWLPTTTGDQWINWMAPVNLVPGTNTVAVYAVDATGNRSLTNTLKMLYVLTDVLTVRTNGKGTLTPAYNGKALQLGANFSMTAKTAKGFIFTNWADGLGNILTNKVTLKFTMASNLTFVANFADITPPTNGIGSPTANQRWSNSVFTVTGRAGDNLAVSNVVYSLNGADWAVADTANNWSNWTTLVTLVPGTNTISAFAVDTTGLHSKTNTVKVIYQPQDYAPGSLNGLLAAITPAGQSTFYIGCWTNTFSQFATDTNNDTGVGAYTYTKLGTNTARLAVTYTLPPPVAGDGGSVFLTFTTNNICNFSNEVNGVDFGNIVLTPQPSLVPTSFNGRKAIFINSEGQPTRIALGNGTLILTNSDGGVENGSYSAKQYSPVGTLLRVIQSGQTNFVQLTFFATNHGAYYITSYDVTGVFNGVDYGAFALLSSAVGGNALTSLAGRSARLWDAGALNDFGFGTTTFSQFSTDTNENNGVGVYTYTNLGPNSAHLAISYLAPPVATNGGGAVTLNFVAPNFCIFTNQDDLGSNYLAAMSFTPATSPVPPDLAGKTITATSIDGVVDVVTFNGGGTFSQTETGSDNPGISTGTFTFTPYGSNAAMLQLNFTGGAANGFTAYIETVFRGEVPGAYFATDFDGLGNLVGLTFGNFTTQ